MREFLKPAHPFIALLVAAVAAVAAIAQCGLLLDSASTRQSVLRTTARDGAVKVVAKPIDTANEPGLPPAAVARSN